MHYVYILHSSNKNAFYIGETSDIEERIIQHNTGHFTNAYTKIAQDWIYFHLISCENSIQARKIEKHIKSMKSKSYFINLSKYPEMTEKLLSKY
ncbi:GIY-YIG nuclease family protein [Gillisia sp. M10.2A]|uniref:GIY-YIG nuclease family protein n=1 Tax=Gillisia lutea TaxID=2909668 RepID=A0ABS9EFZ2_9FLAO|nr:GIY-YIG nuclease family protein [Gillisia lutea]MCF4100769.1 GIY-YIG nuclease family protein [Gillisia lutea]